MGSPGPGTGFEPGVAAGAVDLGWHRHEVEPAGGADELPDLLLRRWHRGSRPRSRSAPWVWTMGSATPVGLTRFSMMLRMVSICSAVGVDAVLGDGLVLAAQAALEVEAQAGLGELGRAR